MVQRVKQHLVPNWQKAWKWLSVQAMVISAAFQLTWGSFPEDLKQHIDAKTAKTISVSILILGVVGRLVKQKDGDHGPDQERG